MIYRLISVLKLILTIKTTKNHENSKKNAPKVPDVVYNVLLVQGVILEVLQFGFRTELRLALEKTGHRCAVFNIK